MKPVYETHWLNSQFHTLFRVNHTGRIIRENDPDRSPGPLFWLGGSADGNLIGISADLPDSLAATLTRIAASEPPFVHPAMPEHLADYEAQLQGYGNGEHSLSITWRLPHDHPYSSRATLVSSESEEGQRLATEWAQEGLPQGLCELGFASVADLWTPWCAAMAGNDVASLAFAARLSHTGAELGLATVGEFRGQGFGAAATAGWSRLNALRSRTLFYNTSRDNISSQRVTERLMLSACGAGLRFT